jgi:hypothetical protein
MCVLREHCRSAHPATSDDPTGGSLAVTRNRSGHAAAPSRAQSYGLGAGQTLLKVNVGPAPRCGINSGQPDDINGTDPLPCYQDPYDMTSVPLPAS